MLQSTPIDARQFDLVSHLDAEAGDLRSARQGDFAHGQRTDRGRPRVIGDFATGMRLATGMHRLSGPRVTGSFASGMQSSDRLTTIGDFATGMRTVSAAVVVDDRISAPDELRRLAA
jgi:hypothetical protein